MKPSGNKPSQINAHIYLGSKDHAKSLPLIKSLGITHILNCTPTRTIDPECGCPNYFEKDASASLIYKRIPIFDNKGEDISSHLDNAYKFIEQSQHYGKILVHCHKGISRSATFIIAYLMKKNELTVPEALEYVKNIRPIVNPNESFISQLNKYHLVLEAERIALENIESSNQITNKNPTATCNINPIYPMMPMVVPTSLEIPEEKVDETTTENRFARTNSTEGDNSISTPSIPFSDYSCHITQEVSHKDLNPKKSNFDLTPEDTQSAKKQKI